MIQAFIPCALTLTGFTSSNVVEVVEIMSQPEIVYIPDKLMGLNLQKMTSKKIIT